MRRRLKSLGVAILCLAIVAAGAGVVFSRVYWGYWTRPPSIALWVHELRSVDALGFVACAPDQPARVERVSASEVHASGASYNESPRDYPGYQLLAALELAGTALPQATVSAADGQRLCDALFESGAVVKGDPGYEYASSVRGFVVTGPTASGARAWIWSAIGGEVSNDHHPVYDLEFSDASVLTRSHVYFEDVAGIEGARWHLVAIVVFLGGTLLLTAGFVVVSIVMWMTRVARRHLSR